MRDSSFSSLQQNLCTVFFGNDRDNSEFESSSKYVGDGEYWKYHIPKQLICLYPRTINQSCLQISFDHLPKHLLTKSQINAKAKIQNSLTSSLFPQIFSFPYSARFNKKQK